MDLKIAVVSFWKKLCIYFWLILDHLVKSSLSTFPPPQPLSLTLPSTCPCFWQFSVCPSLPLFLLPFFTPAPSSPSLLLRPLDSSLQQCPEVFSGKAAPIYWDLSLSFSISADQPLWESWLRCAMASTLWCCTSPQDLVDGPSHQGLQSWAIIYFLRHFLTQWYLINPVEREKWHRPVLTGLCLLQCSENWHSLTLALEASGHVTPCQDSFPFPSHINFQWFTKTSPNAFTIWLRVRRF